MKLAEIQAEYARLCAERDAVNGLAAPVQAELDAAVARMEAARVEAEALAARVQEIRGGAKWLKLKREIAIYAEAVAQLTKLAG